MSDLPWSNARRCLRIAWTLGPALGALAACDHSAKEGSGAATTAAASAFAAGTTAAAAVAPMGSCSAASSEVVYLDSGISAAEKSDFFHLAEGSELLPTKWVLALRNKDGSKFLDVERPGYGLLAHLDDPQGNRLKLPIGLTSAPTPDTELLHVEMLGINCAACHVGELVAQGKTYRILGAPNIFDIQAFFGVLVTDIDDTVRDLGRLLRFAAEAWGDEPSFVEGTDEQVRAIRSTLPPLDDLKSGSGAAMALHERLAEIQSAELRKEIPLGPGLKVVRAPPVVRPPGPGALLHPGSSHSVSHPVPAPVAPHSAGAGTRTALPEDVAALLKTTAAPKTEENAIGVVSPAALTRRQDALLGVELKKKLRADSELSTLADEIPGLKEIEKPKRARALASFLGDFERRVRILVQRLRSLRRLRGGGPSGPETDGGPGRIDAFMGAHNSVFQAAPPAELTSPVDYPALFDIGRISWFHWDANTTSLTERNVGQAIGLGAVVDLAGHVSTIRIGNIIRLEAIATKLRPPTWPFDTDGTLVKAGEVLFASRCAGCHDEAKIDKENPFLAHDVVGTDERRAVNFDRKVGSLKFSDALHAVLEQVVADAIAFEQPANVPAEPPARWRTTNGYVERTLSGVWASAPFLHNGSVPSLADLLNPPDDRPSAFSIGSRAYDPSVAGYCTPAGAEAAVRDTTKVGNSRKGHAYTEGLTQQDRRALLEYLKTR